MMGSPKCLFRSTGLQPRHLVINNISAPQKIKAVINTKEAKESRLTATSFCFLIAVK